MNNEEEFNLEEELQKDPEEEFGDEEGNPLWLWTKRGLGILLVLALLYIYGLDNFFQFRRTPESAEQPNVEKQIDAETINLPLDVYVVRSKNFFGSSRDEENVRDLIQDSSKIWKQAAIDFEINNLYIVERERSIIENLYNNPRGFVNTFENYNRDIINVILVGNIGGINGVAFSNLNMVAVADYTTVPDFRVLAHEIGHILDLRHVSDQNLLMYQGASDYELTLEEIERARVEAMNFEG